MGSNVRVLFFNFVILNFFGKGKYLWPQTSNKCALARMSIDINELFHPMQPSSRFCLMLPMSMMQAVFAPFLLALSFQRENLMDLETLELSKSGLDKAHSNKFISKQMSTSRS